MHRLTIVVLSLTGLALIAGAAGSVAASPAKGPWKILLTTNREGDSEVYSVNADGSGARRLTRSVGFDGFATWSPDRRRIIYHSQERRTGRVGAYIVNPDGSGRRPMPGHGSWSPDGRMIAYTDGRDGNGEIYVVNADGSKARNLSQSPSSQEFSPAWSPDGKTIAFVSDRDGNEEIYAMDADGGNQRNLTKHPLSDGGVGRFALLWSPNGRTIVFTTNRDRNRPAPGRKVTYEIYLMNADGTGPRRLTRSPEDEYLLAWSADGTRLAFQRWPSKPRWAFFLMNPDGSGVRRVTWALPRLKG
jgi:Tol biopolymer transport system component